MAWEHKEWLTLSEVAQMLGVHPSTLRIWANQGKIPVHRTNGGHRRFRRSELEVWLAARNQAPSSDIPQEVIQAILHHVHLRIRQGQIEEADWFRKIDEEARLYFREAGRQLIQHLWAYLTSEDDQAVKEAISLGYQYAARARQIGLDNCEAIRSFLFFAQAVVEAVLDLSDQPQIQASPLWVTLLKKVHTFLREVGSGMLETFEAYRPISPSTVRQP